MLAGRRIVICAVFMVIVRSALARLKLDIIL